MPQVMIDPRPAMPPLPLPDDCGIPDDLVWRMSVEQSEWATQVGVLSSDDPIELLEGWLIRRHRKTPGHVSATRILREQLTQFIRPRYFVGCHDPVVLDDSVPEPDLSVIRGGIELYAEQHPKAEDVDLIVEVSDSTLSRDRGSKKRIYARAAVPVYWIVNLLDRQVEVYTAPSGPDAAEPDYAQMQTFGPDDSLPVILDGTEVGRLTVCDLLP